MTAFVQNVFTNDEGEGEAAMQLPSYQFNVDRGTSRNDKRPGKRGKKVSTDLESTEFGSEFEAEEGMPLPEMPLPVFRDDAE